MPVKVRSAVAYYKRRQKGLVYTPAVRRRFNRNPRYPSKGSLGSKIFGASPFPIKKNVKMYYAETFTLSSGTAGVVGNEVVLRLNSCYDINFSGTGGQPYGYDQMTALYQKYLVKKVDVKLTFYDPNTEGIVVVATMQPSGSSTTTTGQGLDALQMQPMTWTKYVPTTGGQSVVFKQTMKISAIEGLSQAQFAGALDDYSSDYNANPAETPYIRFSCAAVRGDSAATVICKAELTFHTQFFDRIPLGAS